MLVRRLLHWLHGCRHDGPVVHLRPLGSAGDLWRCARCDAEIVSLDVDALERERRAA